MLTAHPDPLSHFAVVTVHKASRVWEKSMYDTRTHVSDQSLQGEGKRNSPTKGTQRVHVCVQMCASTCVNVRACTHTCVHMYMYVCECVCACMCECARVHDCMCMRACVHVCMHVRLCMCECVCVCVSVQCGGGLLQQRGVCFAETQTNVFIAGRVALGLRVCPQQIARRKEILIKD